MRTYSDASKVWIAGKLKISAKVLAALGADEIGQVGNGCRVCATAVTSPITVDVNDLASAVVSI